MNQRLRNQPVTAKPRIVVNGDSFKVEYWGVIVKDHCGVGYPTFAMAVEHANDVARRRPLLVGQINIAQRNARGLRKLRKALAA